MLSVRAEPKAESSANVFLENVHAASKLETTYYATDRKQQTDFFWYREPGQSAAGIRVNIGLRHINVVPVYEDVRHEGDNEFVLANPNVGAEEKARFRRLLLTRCRCVSRLSRVRHKIVGVHVPGEVDRF